MLDNGPSKFLLYKDIEDDMLGWEYETSGYAQRGLIQSQELDALYQAMGQAVQRMPRLRLLKFSLRGENTDAEDSEFLEFSRDETSRETQLKMGTEWNYHLGDDVLAAWSWCLEGEKAKELRQTLEQQSFSASITQGGLTFYM